MTPIYLPPPSKRRRVSLIRLALEGFLIVVFFYALAFACVIAAALMTPVALA